MSFFHTPARPLPSGARRTVLLIAALLLLLLPGAPAPAQVRPRLRAQVVERQIGHDERHTYSFELSAGELLGIVVEQDRADVVVELFDPLGEKVAEMDSPDFWMWEEEIAVVAGRSGVYRLVVRDFPILGIPPGFYRMRIDGPRAPRGDDALRIEALREVRAAHVARARHEAKEELAHLEKALLLWKGLGDRRREAEALYQLVEKMADVELGIEASQRFHQAVGLWRELGLPDQQAWTLLESSRRGIFPDEEARRYMEEALELARQAGNAFLEVRTLNALGRFHQHQPRTAAGYYQDALRIAEASGDRRQQLHSTYELAYVYDDLAEKQDALVLYEEALVLSRAIQDGSYEANTLNSLGFLYASLGDRDKAISHYQQAIDLSRRRGDTQQEGAALNNLALLYDRLDPEQARQLYKRSLALGVETGNREIQAMAMNNLAFLDLRAGNPSCALERSLAALPLTEGNRPAEIHVRLALGIAYRKLDDLDASRRELKAALDLSRERQDRVRESHVVPELARTERKAGDLQKALALLEEGIRILELVRAEVVQNDLRASFLASRKDTYELYADTLMALHRAQPGRGYDARALQASEQARARTLLDILAEAGADVREGADPELIEQERRLLAEIERLEQRRLELLREGAPSAAVREVGALLEAALEKHGAVETELRVSSPRYAALTQPRPLTVEEIRSSVLDGRALLLEYALGEEVSYLWAVTRDSLLTFELPPRARIEEAARRWYDALRVHPREPGAEQAAADVREAAAELSAMLLGPVQGLLSGQPLLVVSDGALQYLPFSALPVPGFPERALLIDRHELVSLPSASALAVLRREIQGRAAAPKTLAVLADPVFLAGGPEAPGPSGKRGGPEDLRAGEIDPRKLPRLRFSRVEADAIAALVPEPERFKALGFEATRAVAIGGELARYRLVHFATHGLIDSRQPELSSLVLSLVDEQGKPQNGFLRLHDVYNLELRADLVVLSACQTALGQEIRGEGLVGLTRGFMYAGAARVLASLWNVDDRATSVLMESFYRHMISSRMSPAAALRQAQREMSRDPRWSSPYYWAGFSLQGEWR